MASLGKAIGAGLSAVAPMMMQKAQNDLKIKEEENLREWKTEQAKLTRDQGQLQHDDKITQDQANSDRALAQSALQQEERMGAANKAHDLAKQGKFKSRNIYGMVTNNFGESESKIIRTEIFNDMTGEVINPEDLPKGETVVPEFESGKKYKDSNSGEVRTYGGKDEAGEDIWDGGPEAKAEPDEDLPVVGEDDSVSHPGTNDGVSLGKRAAKADPTDEWDLKEPPLTDAQRKENRAASSAGEELPHVSNSGDPTLNALKALPSSIGRLLSDWSGSEKDKMAATKYAKSRSEGIEPYNISIRNLKAALKVLERGTEEYDEVKAAIKKKENKSAA
jgi:hypothetical protein